MCWNGARRGWVMKAGKVVLLRTATDFIFARVERAGLIRSADRWPVRRLVSRLRRLIFRLSV